MAKVSGGAAYQRLQVPKDGISQAMQFWGTKIGEQQQRKKLGDQAVQEAEKKRRAKMLEGLPDTNLTAVMMNQKSADHVNRNFAIMQTNKAKEYERLAREAWDRGDDKEYYRYSGLANQVVSSFKEYNSLITQSKANNKDYFENPDTYNPYDPNTYFNDAFVKDNYIPYVDDKGNMRVVVGVDMNKDGQVTGEERKRVDNYIRSGAEDGEMEFKDISAYDYVNNFYQPFKKVEITEKDGLLDSWANATGLVTKDERTGGYFINKSVKFDDNKYDELRSAVEVSLADPSARAWAINSMPKKGATINYKDEKGNMKSKTVKGNISKVRDFTDEEVQDAVDFYTQQTIARYKTDDTLEFLGSKYSTDVGYTKFQQGREDREKKGSIGINPIVDGQGNILEGEYQVGTHLTTVDREGGWTFDKDLPKGLITDLPEAKITSLKKSSDGTWYAQVSKPVIDELGDKTTEIQSNVPIKKDTDMNLIAKELGHNTFYELTQAFEQANQDYLQRTGQVGTAEGDALFDE